MRARCTVIPTFLVAIVLAGTVQGATLYSYNFDNLNSGWVLTAEGGAQDGWGIAEDWTDCYVTTDDGNATKAVTGSGSTSGLSRSINPLNFTSADTAITQEVWVKNSVNSTGGAYTGAYMGLTWSGVAAKRMLFGGSGDMGHFTTYFRSAIDHEVYGDTLAADHWYDIKWVMDFGTAGGLGTLYYRDMTAEATTFTKDSTLVDVNMGLTPTDGKYTANGVTLRVDAGDMGKHFVDTFSVSSVPEPSAVVLGSLGLLGLLAYAWRKRK